MALITSAASGNFNATGTWTGGVVPTTGDEARASTGHTVTITANATCDEISNAGTGKFVINNGVTLTANVTHKGTTNTTICLEFSANAPATAAVVGNVEAGAGPARHAVANLGTGTLNITGSCTAGNTSGTQINGVNNASTGTVNITGNCYGITSGSAVGAGANNNTTGTLNITGNCFGGAGSGNSQGALNSSTGIMSIIGTIYASNSSNAVASSNRLATNILSGPFVTELVNGTSPICCAAWRWNASPSNSTYLEVATNTFNAKRTLYTADNITGMPDEADVKDGVTYGPVGELTGSMAYTLSPSVAEIQAAVWGAATKEITGGTVDTLTNAPSVPSAATIASQVRTELATELGKISDLNTTRLGQVATTEIVGAQLAAALS